MQRRGMVARLGDDMAQNAVGLVEPAGLLVLGRELHQLRDALGARCLFRRQRHLRRGPARRREGADGDLGKHRAAVRARFSPPSSPHVTQGDNPDA